MNVYQPLLRKDLEASADYEGRLEVLRRFTRDQQNRIRDRDLSGQLGLENLFLELSLLAEAVLTESEQLARNELERSGERGSGPFAIVAMGKFGGRELTYHSDLDVIFFYDLPEGQEFATRLATRTISALSLLTQNGWAYRIDAALRPSGNSGTLVSSLASFRDYHHEIGRTWEKQALVKARPIVGPPDFRERLLRAFEEISYGDGADPQVVASEIDHLRGRMEREIAKERPGRYDLKTGYGGLVDIEFAVQYLQLVHGRNRPNLREPNTLSALAALTDEKILDPGLAQVLRKAYLFYRELETRLRLALDQSTDELWEGSEVSQRMIVERFGGRPIFEELKRTREEVRSLYRRLLKGKES